MTATSSECSTKCHGNQSNSCWDISLRTTDVNLLVVLEGKSRDQVIRIYSLGTMNGRTKLCASIYWDISVWTKVVAQHQLKQKWRARRSRSLMMCRRKRRIGLREKTEEMYGRLRSREVDNRDDWWGEEGSFDGLRGDGLKRRRSAVCSHEPASLHHYIICPVKGSSTKRSRRPGLSYTVDAIVKLPWLCLQNCIDLVFLLEDFPKQFLLW